MYETHYMTERCPCKQTSLCVCINAHQLNIATSYKEAKHGAQILCQPGFTRYNMIRCGLITPCWLFVWRQRGSGKIPPQGDIGCALRRALFLFLRVTWLPERNNNDDGEILAVWGWRSPPWQPPEFRATDEQRWTVNSEAADVPSPTPRSTSAPHGRGLSGKPQGPRFLFNPRHLTLKWVYVHMCQRPFPVRVSFVH